MDQPRESIDHDLPPHWFRYYTEDEDHEEYFYNEMTGETTWEHPSLLQASPSEEDSNAEEAVDEGTLKPHASEELPPLSRMEEHQEEHYMEPEEEVVDHHVDVEPQVEEQDVWVEEEEEVVQDPLQHEDIVQEEEDKAQEHVEEYEAQEHVEEYQPEEQYEDVDTFHLTGRIPPPPPPPPPPPISSLPPTELPAGFANGNQNSSPENERLFYTTADAHKTHTQQSIWDEEVDRIAVSTRLPEPVIMVTVINPFTSSSSTGTKSGVTVTDAVPEIQSNNKIVQSVDVSSPYNPEFQPIPPSTTQHPASNSNPFGDDQEDTGNPFAAPSHNVSITPASNPNFHHNTLPSRNPVSTTATTTTTTTTSTRQALPAPQIRPTPPPKATNAPPRNPILDSNYSRYRPNAASNNNSNNANPQRTQQQQHPPKPPTRRRPDLFGPPPSTTSNHPQGHPTAQTTALEYDPQHVVASETVVATLITEEHAQPVRLPKSNATIPIDYSTSTHTIAPAAHVANNTTLAHVSTVVNPPPAKQPMSMMEALKRDKLLRQQQQQPSQAPSSSSTLDASRSRSPLVPNSAAAAGTVAMPGGVAANPQLPLRQVSTMLRHNFDNVPPHVVLSPNVKLLMYYGIRYAAAEEALANGHQDAWKAYHEIHEAIVSHTLNNPYASLSHIYFPRISTRIKSWMPNFQEDDKKDYHTCYVVTVTYHRIAHPQDALISYRITLRYNQFKDLHIALQRHLKHTEIIEPFPMASVSQSLFGLDDNQRNERMNRLDAWLREVLINAIAMTTKEIVQAVYRLLEVEQQTQQS